MTRKAILSIALFVCWQLGPLQAQAIAGGELYYELTGPKKFKVTAHIYRLCESQGINVISGAVYGGSFQVAMAFTRVKIQKINDTCGNPCKVQNAVSTPGFEKHTFEAMVDFNVGTYTTFVNNKICNVTFGVKMGGRVSSNIHAGGTLFLDAGTNICDTSIKKNHSPVFTMEPKFLASCNQPLQYSPGPLDTFDYDSLGFEILPIPYDYNKNLTYNTNYSGSIPLTPFCTPNPNITNCKPIPTAVPPRGFYFDNSLCEIILTPTKCTDKGYVRFRMNEYRRNSISGQMVLIGFVNREMLMQIRQDPNNNPVVLSSNSSILNLCTNDIQINVKTTDNQDLPNQAKPDTAYLFWDNGFHPAKFKILDTSREKTADIRLEKDSSIKQIKRHFFTVGAYDKLCNISLITKGFMVADHPFTAYKISNNINSCNVWRYQVNNPDTNHRNDVKTSLSIFDPNLKKVFSSDKNSDSFTFNNNGRHIIQYSISNAPFVCDKIVYDTLMITNSFHQGLINTGNDTTVCKPYQAQLKFYPYKSPGLIQIEWFKNDSIYNVKDSLLKLTLGNDAVFKLKLTNNKGCKAESRLTYAIKVHNALPDFPLTQCKYTLASFTAIINTLKTPIVYKWNLNGKDTTLADRTLNLKLTDSVIIILYIKDNNNCVFHDTALAYVKPFFSYELKQDKKEICINDSLIFTAANVTAKQPYRLLWRTSKTDTMEEDTIFRRKFTANKTVLISITDVNSCTLLDSAVIQPINIPKAKLPSFPILCEGDLVNINPAFVPNASPKTFIWKHNNKIISNSDSFYSFNIRVASTILLRSSNKLGCYSEDSTVISMNPRPDFNILSNINYNRFQMINLNTDKAFNSYQWFNNEVTRVNTFWASSLGSPGKHTIWCNVTDSNRCNGGDTIDIFTDKYTSISEIKKTSLDFYPNPAGNLLHIDISEESIFSIYSMDGMIIQTQKLEPGLNLIDISGLGTGIYLIEIFDCRRVLLKQ